MAQTRSAAVEAVARVEVIAPGPLGALAVEALRTRGITGRVVDAPSDSGDLVAWALAQSPTAAAAVEVSARCARAAEAGRPVCLLLPALRGTGRAAIERAAALSHLRAHGAAITHDIDAWLEAVVLLAHFGLPPGSRTAVVAPDGSWLLAQANAIVAEADALGTRSPITPPDDPADVMFYDPGLGPPAPSRANAHLLKVPVVPRAEVAADEIALYGARAALGAVAMLGGAAERIAVGLGPAPRAATAELGIDQKKLLERLAKVEGFSRIGDHDTKGLLRAYGIEITRQTVAMTPSMAVKKAREVGFPVEIKPWGHDLPSEPQGCPVQRDITSDALVRQAFTTIVAQTPQNEAVVIRETPPSGREVSVTFLELPSLGWTVVLDAPGARLAAAPAPLRLIDAQALAAHVIASRAGDPEPDRSGLANILRRASHLVIDIEQIATLELPRVIVGGRAPVRTLVVDASATLRRS